MFFNKEYFLGEDIKYQQIQNFACFPFKYLAPFLFPMNSSIF